MLRTAWLISLKRDDFIHRAGSGEKKYWYGVLSLPLPVLTLHFFLLSSPSLFFFPSIPLFPFLIPGIAFSRSSWESGECSELLIGSWLNSADKRFLVHSELKITLPLIALLQKFSHNEIRKFWKPGAFSLAVVLACPHNILVWRFSEKKWRYIRFRVDQGSTGIMTFRPNSSRVHSTRWSRRTFIYLLFRR